MLLQLSKVFVHLYQQFNEGLLKLAKMKTSEITTGQFFDYLQSLGLFRWMITSTKSGMEAILSQDSKPELSNFTQVLKNDDGTWFVRLSKLDYFNKSITRGYFE